jgi:DNA-binding response OmpR family regulator
MHFHFLSYSAMLVFMRILLVEDEYKLAASLKKALEIERYAVDVVHDGETALHIAFSESYDLVILDIGLPKLSGREVAVQLREEKFSAPILILTAHDTTLDKINGLDSGADDYLVKPFDFEELLAHIRALLRRGSSSRTPLLRLDSLELDPATQVVTRAHQQLKLRPKEYALLEFFLRHPRQVLTKTQLIEHVWDAELDPFSHVVDVYIGYLRQKIDYAFPAEKPLLHTFKGRGYTVSDQQKDQK